MFKNLSLQPFKTENTRFLWVTYLWRYSWKMHLKHKTFRGKSLVAKQSWDSRKSLCLNFMFSSFALTYFCGKSVVASFSRKCLWRSFWRKHEKYNLTKNLKHESIKTLSKTYKILKNLFGFDRQAIEHAHHI